MAHEIHDQHGHVHGSGCGHVGIRHAGHVDYLHDGHLHHAHDGHFDEHRIEVDAANPAACRAASGGHDGTHRHREGCGHPSVPHGDHVDYLVDGVLHHSHEGHCDDHGRVEVA